MPTESRQMRNQTDQTLLAQSAFFPERRHCKLPTSLKFKKDAMWKPLIRMFRRFLKKRAIPKATLKRVKETKLSERATIIEQALGLPEELVGQRYTKLACLIMINSHRLVHDRKMKTQCRRLFPNFNQADEMWARYFSIFLDNNSLERVTFFSDPLI